jgi:hypothetical protein
VSKENKNTFILATDAKGQKFLCPINDRQKASAKDKDSINDCIEAEVIGRYDGNLN